MVKHRDRTVRNTHRLRRLVAVLACAALLVAPLRAGAQSFIRDAEIEATIQAYADPVFKAANLDASSIDLFLIADDTLNAFVAGGMNMFLHTGLLRASSGPLEVIGVMAHEAGHIAGGHIAGRRREMQQSTTEMLASYALGLAAGVLTGRPDAGLAAMQLGQGAVISGLLAYTRSQEGAADQAAATYLKRAGYSPEGLLSFMQTLQDQQALLTANQDPYLQTHPLTRDRIRFLENVVANSENTGKPPPSGFERKHERMLAKLDGFLQPPRRTLQQYEVKDALPARYARSIAHFRNNDLEPALAEIEELIEKHPDDPYFHELKGQMLYENGRIAESIPPYQRAVDLRPDSSLLRLALARAQVQRNLPELNEIALGHLDRVLAEERRNAEAWRLKAIAHGRMDDMGMSALSLAESRLARGQLGEARRQSQRALSILDENTPPWLRAQDIKREAERRIERRQG